MSDAARYRALKRLVMLSISDPVKAKKIIESSPLCESEIDIDAKADWLIKELKKLK